MNARIPAFVVALATAPALAIGGASLIIPVSKDESVCSAAPDKNYSDNLNRGGLFVGSDGTGTSRFYLQFDIPASVKPESVVAASLWATYFDDFDRADNGVSRIHFVASDDWTEDTLTWDNQPGPAYGTAEAVFDSSAARVGDVVSFDVSTIVKEQLEVGDRAISFLFAAANEGANRDNRNWEYFAEREFDPDKAFKLTLHFAGRGIGSVGGSNPAIPAPLPAAAWPALITLAGAAGVALRKRLRRA